MDLKVFMEAAVNGIPIMFLVIGVVQLFKLFKRKDGEPTFSGNALLLISFAWGLILGCGYMIFTTRPVVGDWWTLYGYWFGVFVYGMAIGLLASVFWDLFKGVIEKSIKKYLDSLSIMQDK